MNIDKEREAFEAWYRQHHGRRDMFELDRYGEYADKQVQSAFNVWQARAALDEQKAGPSDDLGTIITTLESLRATLQAYRLGEYADMLLAALKTTRALRSKYAAPSLETPASNDGDGRPRRTDRPTEQYPNTRGIGACSMKTNLYRKKPVVIEATQWFKNGDHPLDYSREHDGLENGKLRTFAPDERRRNGWEGDIVRYYRKPDDTGERECQHCKNKMHFHGWIDTLEGGHIVCPGDWIITGVKGERYPCKPEIFETTYELLSKYAGPVNDQDAKDAQRYRWLKSQMRAMSVDMSGQHSWTLARSLPRAPSIDAACDAGIAIAQQGKGE